MAWGVNSGVADEVEGTVDCEIGRISGSVSDSANSPLFES